MTILVHEQKNESHEQLLVIAADVGVLGREAYHIAFHYIFVINDNLR